MHITRDADVIHALMRACGSEADVGPALQRGGFAIIEPDKAVYVFDRVEAGVYEAHQYVHPDCRNKSIAFARQARDLVFTATDATELIGRTPVSMPEARMVAIKAGFRPLFQQDEYEVVSLDILQWASRARRHRAGGEQLRAAGLTQVEDELHDQYVGIVLACARAGTIDKGIWLYNQYAHLTGYAKASVYSRLPPVIDFDGTHVLVTKDSVEEI